jgi:hypothetical protein
MIAAIDDPVMIRRLLNAKAILLWFLVAPFCLVVALVSGIVSGYWLATLYSAICIAIIPIGVLGVSQWMGIIWPYHQMPLRFRLTHIHPWGRKINRWILLITMPYLYVPFVTMVLITPSLMIWGFSSKQGLTKQIPHNYLAIGVAVACIVSFVTGFVGRRASCWILARRRQRTIDFLADPTYG